MASHNHHHHHHHHQQQLNCAGGTTNCCCSSCCSHPSPQPTEPLLQAIASQLFQQQQHQQQPGSCCQGRTHITRQSQNFRQKIQNFHHHQQEKFVLSSLLSRIDALEASLQNFSLSSTSFSLRDMAARVIQTHFRAFLKALDLLLILDSLQGGDPMIRDGKRSVSKDLIKFLEFVDGFVAKRHEISTKAAKNVRFVGNSIKPRNFRTNGGYLSGDQAEVMSKVRDRIEKIHAFSRVIKSEYEDVELESFHEVIDGDDEEENPSVYGSKNGVLVKRYVVAQPKVKKNVTFAENGNVYRFIDNGNGKSNGSISSGDGTLTDESASSDGNGQGIEVKEINDLPKETEDEKELYFENGVWMQSPDGERNPRRSMKAEGRNEIDGDYKVEDGQFVFSAPMPVKMESRADLMKKRKALKIVA
ncbi:BAG family molecular chaperone regulator 8, chloroplastic isoform X3 [Citrus sinensis]|uniref:BAG family molecular chaperone regulator 8, chloroplastic isoform X3 n=1 Tax=Citrus sinensis TaxID=2711 RepID=UPI00227814A0|nr:BAG family molecular chaperone regulator 8, chloroplastic isoform X3 [Citrus sinensis]